MRRAAVRLTALIAPCMSKTHGSVRHPAAGGRERGARGMGVANGMGTGKELLVHLADGAHKGEGAEGVQRGG